LLFSPNPFTNAKQLGEFVDYLFEATGHEEPSPAPTTIAEAFAALLAAFEG